MSSTAVPSKATGAVHYRGYIAELDSLRAFGILLVLVSHFWPESSLPWIYRFGQCGWIAMDSFFVLSGFLISGILLDSRERSDYFRNFYARRTLRIFPLYYLILIVLVLMTRLSHGGSGNDYKDMVQHWGSPAWFFVYLGNFRTAYMNSWPTVAGFRPLWSLQIEEQFYLLFPFAVLWMRRDHLARFLWALVVLTPLCRLLAFFWRPGNVFTFVLLPCHMEGLALGALLAIRLRNGPWKIHKTVLAFFTAALLLTVIVSTILSPDIDVAGPTVFNRLFGDSIASFGCVGLILWLILFRGSRHTRVLRAPAVQYLAKISYGIYLLQELAARATVRWLGKMSVHLRSEGLLRFVVVVALSVLFAAISWHFFEQPILRLKDRIAPRPGARPIDA